MKKQRSGKPKAKRSKAKEEEPAEDPMDVEAADLTGPAPVEAAAPGVVEGTKEQKERVLVLCTRGTAARYRHLMLDLVQLLPHCKKESKLDVKKDFRIVADIAEIKSCSSAVLFECRKFKDLYVWMSKAPQGPSIKFIAQNIHTMSELRLSGNHLKGSRPVLSFDKNFDTSPHYQLTRELLRQVFATPLKHHKSKPFFDHVISFSIVDDRIWIRNYQVVPEYEKSKVDIDATTLIEVGPRVTLQIIRIFDGPFGGRCLFHNPDFVSPNTIRSAMRKRKAAKHLKKQEDKAAYKEKMEQNKIPTDELQGIFK